MVFVSEATTWPADVWYFQSLKRSHNIVANASRVRDVGIRTNPDTLVNAMAEVFGELAEDVAVDLRARLGYIN
jgi:hypothetical protein